MNRAVPSCFYEYSACFDHNIVVKAVKVADIAVVSIIVTIDYNQ